jgi:hypothetical protein
MIFCIKLLAFGCSPPLASHFHIAKAFFCNIVLAYTGGLNGAVCDRFHHIDLFVLGHFLSR